MEEWKTYQLKDICELIPGFAFKSGDFGDYKDRVIKIGDIQPPYVSFDSMIGVNLLSYNKNKLDKFLVQKGDFVLAMTGATIGKIGKYISEIPAYINQRVLLFRPYNSVNKEFIYYTLQSSLFQKYILNHIDSETAQPNISGRSVSGFEISLPPRQEQDRIAAILSALDDKIELNNRINHNLEEQAQALFKSWFVDFEPFKDKVFIDSELGLIPLGWDVISLKQILDYRKKSINPQKSPDIWFTHYSLPAYDNSREPEIQKGNEIMSNKFLLEGKSVLFSKLNPRIKRIWPIDEITPNSVCSTEFIAYQAKEEALFPFVWCYLNSDSFYSKVMSEVNGATGSHQRFHADDTLDYVIPFKEDAAVSLSECVAPLLQSIIKNEEENRVLKYKRDTLLPKLMSGELLMTC
jgi:type I restriction enzyme S subunit